MLYNAWNNMYMRISYMYLSYENSNAFSCLLLLASASEGDAWFCTFRGQRCYVCGKLRAKATKERYKGPTLSSDGVDVRNSHCQRRSRDLTATQGVAPPPFDNAMAQAYMQMVQCPMEVLTSFFEQCSWCVRSTMQITHWWMTSQRKSWFLHVFFWISKHIKDFPFHDIS